MCTGMTAALSSILKILPFFRSKVSVDGYLHLYEPLLFSLDQFEELVSFQLLEGLVAKILDGVAGMAVINHLFKERNAV